MTKIPLAAALSLCPLLGLAPGPARGEPPEVSPWVATFNSHHRIVPDLVYRTVDGRELTLDLYLPSNVSGPVPIVFYIHGGAWAHGTKSGELGYMLPWMQLGWAVSSVEYRLTRVAKAPAGVEDCFCALHWVAQHAGQYHFDLDRLVISGASAGGNLALLVGMAPSSAGFDRDCPGGPLPKAAAIVNIAGVTDVADMLAGPHQRSFAIDWIGSAGAMDLARRVSPLSYVRPGLPPVLSVHGDADPTVPYEDAVRLHAALEKAGVSNQLLTIPGGKHGGWRPQDYLQIYATLTDFLIRNHLQASN